MSDSSAVRGFPARRTFQLTYRKWLHIRDLGARNETSNGVHLHDGDNGDFSATLRSGLEGVFRGNRNRRRDFSDSTAHVCIDGRPGETKEVNVRGGEEFAYGERAVFRYRLWEQNTLAGPREEFWIEKIPPSQTRIK